MLETALAIHRESIIVDAHCDVLHMVRDGKPVGEGYGAEEPHIRPGAVEGGLTAQFFAADTHLGLRPESWTARALSVLDVLHRQVAANPESLLLATAAADIKRAKVEGKLAAIAALEGGDFLGGPLPYYRSRSLRGDAGVEVFEREARDELGPLRMFYRLGVRCLALVHFYRNLLGDSVTDMGSGGGLSDFGVVVTKEMNRLGMLVDAAHLSPRGFFELLEVSEDPIIDSHAGCMALSPFVRNLADDQLRALGQAGGIIGIGFVGAFVDLERPTLDRVLDHIEHAAEVAGIDHVGLGSDLNVGHEGPRSGDAGIRGLEDMGKLPNITLGLLKRGYSKEEIEKILGGNILKVFQDVVG